MKQQVSYQELSPQDFLLLGINDIAYVKKELRDGKEIFVWTAQRTGIGFEGGVDRHLPNVDPAVDLVESVHRSPS